MGMHTIKVGLDLPIAGAPEQNIHEGPRITRVAILAHDAIGMRPRMEVKVGDVVKRGQLLFDDRKTPGVRYTSPGAGTVTAIHRAEKRALESVVIALSDREQAGQADRSDQVAFTSYDGTHPSSLDRAKVTQLLAESGLWTALRARPFSKVPSPEAAPPHSIFVTATDSNPLAADVDIVIGTRQDDFEWGLAALRKLTEGKVFLCKRAGAKVGPGSASGITVEEWAGKHPSGLVGLHIHRLDPVDRNKVVWHLGYQDCLAVGRLFRTGELDLRRVISLAGPSVARPRLLTTRLGASTDELVQGQLSHADSRVVSGSVLSGRTAQGERTGYLGRYHQQLTALPEGRERPFLGMIQPGPDRFSTIRAYLSAILPKRTYAMTTSQNGSHRAMVPIGMYERVMPMDILPTHLLRALLVQDTTRAEELGVLELDEEDLSLCTFVCPCKNDYGTALRENLSIIDKEG